MNAERSVCSPSAVRPKVNYPKRKRKSKKNGRSYKIKKRKEKAGKDREETAPLCLMVTFACVINWNYGPKEKNI